MRYRLHTLLFLLAIGPPRLAWSWYGWQAREELAPFATCVATVVTVASVLGVLTAGIMLLLFGQ